MKKALLFSAFCIAAPLLAAHAGDGAKTASATLFNTSGEEIGMASMVQGPHGVLLHIKVSGLTPGKHGLHLHSHGACEAHTGFKSAKGHVGKVEGAHGLLNPNGPEAGDIPNIFIGADGTGQMEAYSTLFSLGHGENNLLDEDGSAFVIHEGADDHITQPIGGAGGRVACGVINAS